MKFIDERLLDYSIQKSNNPSSVCDEIETKTKDGHPLARMLCGKLEASLLGFLIRSHGFKRVLELGTFTGYSALAMAENLPEDGELITIDKNKKINTFAKEHWDKSEHGKKITAMFGEGVNVIPTLEGKFDMVFIDADKQNYLNYLKMTLPLLTEKGIIVVDNVLWSGRVVDGYSDEEDKSTGYIKEINDFVEQSDDLYGTLLPIRDGIFLVQKLDKKN